MSNMKPSVVEQGIKFAKTGDCVQIQAWLAAGNDPNAYNEHGWNPFIWAAARGHAQAVEVFLNGGAKAEIGHRDSGALAIHLAAQSGSVKTVEVLLKHHPDQLNAVFDLNGHTALLQAVFYGHLELADFLLKNGADTSITTARGLGPMELATQFQNKAMMELLRPFDTPVSAKADYYRRYLSRIAPHVPESEKPAQALADELVATIERGIKEAATDMGAVEVTLQRVRELVEQKGADVNRLGGALGQPPLIVTVTGNNGWPTIDSVARLRNGLAKYLLDHGADPSRHENHPMGAQTIIRAAVFNHLEILKMCAAVLTPQQMADCINEYPLVNGLTAMHDSVLRASMAGPDRFDSYLEQIRFFIRHGGRTDIEDFAGVTQRNIAERTTDPEKRRRLLTVIDGKE